MTYLADGKQYIVLGTNDGKLVALSLPDGNRDACDDTISERACERKST